MKGGQSLTTKIFLDAGHGGKDSGAVGNQLQEKNVVLDISKRIENKLKQYKNVEVKQSRTSDVFVKLSERASQANKWGANVFISLHLNSATSPQARGFESFVYNGSINPDTIALQNVMHQEIYRKIGRSVPDRGKKRANFQVLRDSNMKAILVENLFVSNSQDSALLKKSAYLDSVAQGYVNGLEKYFGLMKEIRPPTSGIDDKGPLYQVIAGTYSDKTNAEKQAKKLLNDGYNAYVIEKE